ncbi:hypothetical protein [Streptomyces griseus]|uniref:hypothetical protein n=1 Tax=Streptomyces griseus TaxID=1911 RepID=UPI0033A89078
MVLRILQLIRVARRHWPVLLIIPALMISEYGNKRHNRGYADDWTTRALLFGGLIVAFACLPFLKRFIQEVTSSEQKNERIVWFTLIQSLILISLTLTAVKSLLGTADQASYRSAASILMAMYVITPIATLWIANTAPTFRQLRLRLMWVPAQRAMANVAGISAVAAFIAGRFSESHPAPALSAALTLLVAAAVSVHKTLARTRKLCTQSHLDIQKLIRDMEELHETQTRNQTRSRGKWRAGPPKKTPEVAIEKQMAARRSWDIVKLDLKTTVDSGYGTIALRFLPEDEIAALESSVLAAIADPEAADSARDDLQAILAVCAERIDVLA